MQILIDGTPCDAAAETVAGAIEAGVEHAERDGRRIIEVYVDGQLLSDVQLAEPDRLTAIAREVRLISAHPQAMVRETLLQARDLLEEIDANQQQAAELIQSDQVPAAMAKIMEAIELWQLVQEATLKGSQFGSIDLDQVSVDDESCRAIVAALGEHLKRMVEQLRTRDSIALADTLMYEMPEVVGRWRSLLQQLAAEVG